MMALRPRLRVSRWLRFAVPAASVLLAAGLWGAMIAIQGKNPFTAYGAMFSSVLGSGWGMTQTLLKATPLVLCAAGIAVAARMKLWNIGAEGQIYVGALAASWIPMNFPGLSSWVMLPLMFAGAVLAGGLWCGFCGLLRARLGVSEILTTLMLNYLAMLWVGHLVHGPWRGADNFPYTDYFPASSWLPRLGSGKLHIGVIIALLIVLALYVFERRSVWGFELRVAGAGWDTARYAGVGIGRRIISVMLLSGALAGVTGFVEISGLHHRLQPNVSPGYGFTAIIVCWLARGNLLGCAVVGFLFAGMLVAGEELQVVMRLPESSIHILQSLLLLSVLAGDLLITHRVSFKGRSADTVSGMDS